MKIYTKTGDDGSTALFGGSRVSKAALRVEAYGAVDELNSVIGVVRSLAQEHPWEGVDELLADLQSSLFTMGSELACCSGASAKLAIPLLEESAQLKLEALIDRLEGELPPLRNFILPGGGPVAAHLHQARTVCRRAERALVRLADQEALRPILIIFLNRLSDFLFVGARYANHLRGVDDESWSVR